MIEYVLLLSVFVVGLVAAIGALDDSIEGETVETAAEIGGEPPPSVPTTTPWQDTPTDVSSVPPPPPTTTTTTTSTLPPPTVNLPPFIDEIAPVIVGLNTPVDVTAVASDPENDPLVFDWVAQIPGGGRIDDQIIGGKDTETATVRVNQKGENWFFVSAADPYNPAYNRRMTVYVITGSLSVQVTDESFWVSHDEWVPQYGISYIDDDGDQIVFDITNNSRFTTTTGRSVDDSCDIDASQFNTEGWTECWTQGWELGNLDVGNEPWVDVDTTGYNTNYPGAIPLPGRIRLQPPANGRPAPGVVITTTTWPDNTTTTSPPNNTTTTPPGTTVAPTTTKKPKPTTTVRPTTTKKPVPSTVPKGF